MKDLFAENLRRRIAQINQNNARTYKSADSAAMGFVLVLVLGVVGALLLVHYLTPCDAGTLCMGAVVTRTRTRIGPLAWLARQAFRFRAACRAWYLGTLVRGVEADIADMQANVAWLPHQIDHYEMHLDALRLQLVSAQIDARGD